MTGAAGGLSGGLFAFRRARLVPGAAYVLDLVGFDEGARLVLRRDRRGPSGYARPSPARPLARRPLAAAGPAWPATRSSARTSSSRLRPGGWGCQRA